jgi:DNA-binding transcriptional LysR family regulator
VCSSDLTGTERVARIPLDEFFPQRSYGIVVRRGKFLSLQAKRFLDILDQNLGQQKCVNTSRDPEVGAAGYEDI